MAVGGKHRKLRIAAAALAWALLSAYVGLGSWALPLSLLSAIVYVAGAARLGPLLPLALAMQVPALVDLSLRGNLTLAALLMLAAAYLTELGNLLATEAQARCFGGYLRAKALQATLVAGLTLVTTCTVISAAEALSPPLDFGVAALIASLLAILAYALRARSK